MKKNAIALAVTLAAISGCSTQAVDNAEGNVANQFRETGDYMNSARTMNPRPSMLQEDDGYYLLGEAKEVSAWQRLPKVLKSKTAYNSPTPLSISEILTRISNEMGVRISITSDALRHLSKTGAPKRNDSAPGGATPPKGDGINVPMDLEDMTPEEMANLPPNFKMALNMGDGQSPAKKTPPSAKPTGDLATVSESVKFPVSYEGTVAGLLDYITTRGDLFWEWDNDSVVVFRLKTVNYQLDISKTETELETEISSDRDSSDDAGGSSTTKQSVKSNYKSEDVYGDFMKTINAMLTSDGSATVSPGTGILSLTATPAVHSRVGNYVKKVNEFANRQIALDVKIYELRVENNAEYGIDWSALFSGSERVFAGLTTSYSGAAPNMNLTVVNPTSRFVNSMANASANNENIQFGVVTSNSGITKNGRPLSIQTANEVGYLKKMEAEVGESGQVSYTLEQSSVLQGMTMTVLPKMLSDGSIDMRVAIDIAKLNSLDEVSVGSGSNQSMIQTPNMSSKDFVNIINARNGEPIMMTGMERVENESETNSLLSKGLWFLGGKKNGGTRKVMNMIVITPFVVK